MLKIGSLQHSIVNHDNPCDAIQNFLDIFFKLDDQQKYDVVLYLSLSNKFLDKNFYPLFIDNIFQTDKNFIKNIKINIIIETYRNFNFFYYDFLNMLCCSDYDFQQLKNYFKDYYHVEAIELLTNTFEYIDLHNNIRDF